ncbi:MAG: nuclear transport factor 2 family protein [Ilumatobacteraceae bacterium]
MAQDPISDEDLRTVIDQELALLQPEVRTDRIAFGATSPRGFLEVGVSGRIWRRPELIEALMAEQGERDDEPVASVVEDRVDAEPIGPQIVVVSYRTARPDDDGTVLIARRSSWWQLTPAGWKIRFHLGVAER